MNYILDTNVISELVRKQPDYNVVTWLDGQDELSLYLSVLTIGELMKGIFKLKDPERISSLETWVIHDLSPRFRGRLLPLDEPVMLTWGKLQGQAAQENRTLPLMDSILAATALTHGMTVVTRNTKDLTSCGAYVLNPWL